MKDSISRHLPDLSGSKRRSLTLPLSHMHHRDSEQQNEIREARRFLRDHVRDDFSYPALPRYQRPVRTEPQREGEIAQSQKKGHEAGIDQLDLDGESTVENGIAGFKFYTQTSQKREELLHRSPEQLGFEPTEWREREYSSEESVEENADGEPESDHIDKKSDYKFDSPDSIGEHFSDQKLARKRKRQRRLDEECTWNDGMAHWLARRDAWCGAHTATQVQAVKHRQTSLTASSSGSVQSSIRSSTDSSETDAASEHASTPSTTPDLPSEASEEPSTIPTHPPAPPSEILVPLVPPILVNHPIRRRITPDVYPEIYSKIILQSRAPSVPINLQTMVRALVQGWKDDGEWPPKPLDAGRKSNGTESTLKHGVKAVGRVLRITGGDSGFISKSGS